MAGISKRLRKLRRRRAGKGWVIGLLIEHRDELLERMKARAAIKEGSEGTEATPGWSLGTRRDIPNVGDPTDPGEDKK
jgi:hypothetical protein